MLKRKMSGACGVTSKAIAARDHGKGLEAEGLGLEDSDRSTARTDDAIPFGGPPIETWISLLSGAFL